PGEGPGVREARFRLGDRRLPIRPGWRGDPFFLDSSATHDRALRLFPRALDRGGYNQRVRPAEHTSQPGRRRVSAMLPFRDALIPLMPLAVFCGIVRQNGINAVDPLDPLG